MAIKGAVEDKVYCPACGKEMRQRRGPYGLFYGCMGYPGCKKIVKLEEAWKYHEPPKKQDWTPSDQQENILDFALHGEGHGFVRARAGSGKTTTNIWVGNHLSNYLGLAFNTHIQRVWNDRASKGTIRTTHSLGLWACRRSLPKFKVDEKGEKVRSIAWPLVDAQRHLEYEDKKAVYAEVRQLVSLAKATLNPDLLYVADRYGLALNGDSGLILMIAKYTLEQCRQQLSLVDFDDMPWLPVVLDLDVPQFPYILGDEVQDFNACQTELMLKALEPGGRILAVGDDMQSLYGFRGASVNSIPDLVQRLKATELPLSTSYRCPKSVVELVRPLVSDIQAAPWAEQGEIRYIKDSQAFPLVQEGDMILCRTNAPLVPWIYKLIRQGKKATIRGRDIGRGMIVLIDRFEPKVSSLSELLSVLSRYESKEVQKLLDQDRGSAAQTIQDKVETIFAMSDGCDSIQGIRDRIGTVFSDDRAEIVGSTVHRAKGLEADNVFVIRPDLMPHPLARKDWEIQQEVNGIYVAATRVKKTLTYAHKEEI